MYEASCVGKILIFPIALYGINCVHQKPITEIFCSGDITYVIPDKGPWYIFDLVRFFVFCFMYVYLFTFNGVLIPTEVYLSQYISRSKDCYWFQQFYVFTKIKYKDLQRENILKICMYTFDKKKDCLEIRRRRHSKYRTGTSMCHKLDSCADRNFLFVLQKIPFT